MAGRMRAVECRQDGCLSRHARTNGALYRGIMSCTRKAMGRALITVGSYIEAQQFISGGDGTGGVK